MAGDSSSSTSLGHLLRPRVSEVHIFAIAEDLQRIVDMAEEEDNDK
jgi:hypothetical protein